VPLVTHVDGRGSFTELFREEWDIGVAPVQWNAVRSDPGVLRGSHVHVSHRDYLIVLSGGAQVFLHDLRRGSATEGQNAVVDLTGERLEALVVPTGIAHAFWFSEPSLHVYAVSEYWDPDGELGCHWSDPELGLPTFAELPHVSQRDDGLPPLSVLRAQVEGAQPFASSATTTPAASPDP
jgi:dTDP-4-dehydrorhamnose 3,5-epimerase